MNDERESAKKLLKAILILLKIACEQLEEIYKELDDQYPCGNNDCFERQKLIQP